MATSATSIALPYHEPGIVTILTLTSFLLLLNFVNYALDRIIYVGLIGQIFLGIAFGTPGGKLLSEDTETVIVNLGYLGLLLLVYEGGLNTSFKSLKANLALSFGVAATGIALPIGLSYILLLLANATPIQAFAAGAALCSTSLGTTFTVMQTSGLSTTRMGVVLTSAAMMDDVVGLVMVQIISKLGTGSESFSAVTVVRPLLVSLAFGVIVPLACRYLVLPLTVLVNQWCRKHPNGPTLRLLLKDYTAFFAHTATLVAFITGATYAGTSNLFAAYLAGAAISWWDSEVPHDVSHVDHVRKETEHQLSELPYASATLPRGDKARSGDQSTQPDSAEQPQPTRGTGSVQSNDASCKPSANRDPSQGSHSKDAKSGKAILETYYTQPLQRLLKPFFFASIGFSIPITRMFNGDVVWRGCVYTILMIIGKLACGTWLLRFGLPSWLIRSAKPRKSKVRSSSSSPATTDGDPTEAAEATFEPPVATQHTRATSLAKLQNLAHQIPQPAKPASLYPSTIVGCAMVARGEIGFLISSLAEANGIFGENPNGELFLVVTWAIMLCTIIGPVMVGAMVRRLKSLCKKYSGTDRRDVLGVWGLT